VPPYTFVRDEVQLENPQDRECEFRLKCTNKKLNLPDKVVLEPHALRTVRF